jgi:tight adherence protein C
VALRAPFTNDRWALAEQLDRLTPTAGPRLADALLRSVVEAASSPPGSRAIVLMTSGQDEGSTVSLNEGMNGASRAGIPVYVIALGDDPQLESLAQIANETHGRLFEARTPEDLTQAFRFVRRQVAGQYDIEWTTKLQGQPGREVPVSIEIRGASHASETLALTYKQPPFANIPAAASGPAFIPPMGQPLPILPTVSPPDDNQLLMAGTIFGLGVLLLYWALLRRTVNQRLRSRIVTHISGIEAERGPRRVSLSPIAAWVAGVVLRFMSQGRVQATRGKLMQAGFIADAHLRNFLAAQVALALMVGTYGYLMVQLTDLKDASLVLGLAMGGLGFLLPNFWLGRRISKRAEQIQRAMPDALDMMAVGMTAGLSFDGTVVEIADKWDNPLTQELSLTLSDMRLGASRHDALMNLAARTNIDDIKVLVTALVQADELGTSLSETLVIQAEQLRQQRKFRAEEKAHKAAVKMLIPLVALIFPALFVVILGPAVPRLFESLGAK